MFYEHLVFLYMTISYNNLMFYEHLVFLIMIISYNNWMFYEHLISFNTRKMGLCMQSKRPS